MGYQVLSMGLSLIIAITLWTNTSAQPDCTGVLVNMSPCLDYLISDNSSDPSTGCCTQLRSVVQSQPRCLCQVLNGGPSLGLNINQTRALALPNACNVQTPPPSECNNATSPSGAPSSSPNPPNSNSGDGSSDANSNRMSLFSVIFFLIFTASYVSTFNVV